MTLSPSDLRARLDAHGVRVNGRTSAPRCHEWTLDYAGCTAGATLTLPEEIDFTVPAEDVGLECFRLSLTLASIAWADPAWPCPSAEWDHLMALEETLGPEVLESLLGTPMDPEMAALLDAPAELAPAEARTVTFHDLATYADDPRPLSEILDEIGWRLPGPPDASIPDDQLCRAFDWLRSVLGLALPHRGLAKLSPQRERIERLFVEGDKLVRELADEINRRGCR